jgi:hypothetical protein
MIEDLYESFANNSRTSAVLNDGMMQVLLQKTDLEIPLINSVVEGRAIVVKTVEVFPDFKNQQRFSNFLAHLEKDARFAIVMVWLVPNKTLANSLMLQGYSFMDVGFEPNPDTEYAIGHFYKFTHPQSLSATTGAILE